MTDLEPHRPDCPEPHDHLALLLRTCDLHGMARMIEASDPSAALALRLAALAIEAAYGNAAAEMLDPSETENR